MSRKIIAASIVIIMFGGVSTAGGVFVNGFIDIYVEDQMDVAFLEIESQAIPIVEEIVNETLVANIINININGEPSLGASGIGDFAFFNDASAKYFGLSIAMYTDKGDLNYTALARERLMDGETSLNIPGLITDIDTGSGVNDFLDLYDASSASPDKKAVMEVNYNCTWEHLTYLINWIFEHAIIEGIPSIIPVASQIKPELAGLESTTEIAIFYFKSQWANATLIKDPGFPLPLGFMDVYGLEVGLPVATNMSIAQIDKLWDTENQYSIVNKIGIKRWFLLIEHPDYPIVNSLKKFNGDLSDHAVNCLLRWLFKFKQNVMPYLAQYKMGLPTDSTTLANAIEIGGIAIGGITLGLAGLGFTGSVINTKKSKSLKKVRVPARSGSGALLGGLPKRYSYDTAEEFEGVPSGKMTYADEEF